MVKINAFEISRLAGGGHSLVRYVTVPVLSVDTKALNVSYLLIQSDRDLPFKSDINGGTDGNSTHGIMAI